MELPDVIDFWISQGGEGSYGDGGQYPALQVTRTSTTLSGGFVSRSAATYLNVHASIRPDGDAELKDDPEGRYTLERRKLYTRTAELWPSVGNTSAVGGEGHDADLVTLYPVAASLDLGDELEHVDATIRSVVVGPDGNAAILRLIADGSGAGSYDETGWPTILFHFEPEVTTDADLETAVSASSRLAVATAGTGDALFESGDAADYSLAGGAGELWRVVACARYRGFWKATVERLERP